METRHSRRRVRFFSALTRTAMLVLCSAIFQAAVFAAVIKPSGWFSLEYLKGQSQSPYARGSIQNLRAGFMATGALESKITFGLEIQTRGVSNVELTQAWAGLFSSNSFRVRAGLYLVPFGKYNVSSRPFQTMLVSDPIHLDLLFPLNWRDLGVVIEGQSKVFSYAAYVGNGFGEGTDGKPARQFQDNNSNKAIGARLGIFLGDGFEVGGSYYRGKFDAENRRAMALKGLDLTWMTSDWNVVAEYARSETDNLAPLGKGEAENIFVQLSINYEGLKPVVSFQKYQTNAAFGGLSGAAALDAVWGVGVKGTRWTLGLVYNPAPSVYLKAEYDLNGESDLKLKNNLFLAQVAVQF